MIKKILSIIVFVFIFICLMFDINTQVTKAKLYNNTITYLTKNQNYKREDIQTIKVDYNYLTFITGNETWTIKAYLTNSKVINIEPTIVNY
ncbi:MAG: hypothetical protein RR840_04175 [Clostridium sp.]